jgi:hypothetical protein
MKLKMLETRQGSPDGISVATYEEGQTYDIPKDLAGVFIREDWAEPLKKKEADPAASGAVTKGQKNQGGSPENKGRKKK